MWGNHAWSLVEEPRRVSLVSSSLDAVPESNSLEVTVAVSTVVELEASSIVVSELVVSSSVPLDSLEVGSSVWSGDNLLVGTELSSLWDSQDVVSLSPHSDGVGSCFEDPPLVVVIWVVILDQGSVLRGTNVLVASHKSSLTSQGSQSDLELDAGANWESWVLDLLCISSPALVLTVVAFVPVDVSVVGVRVTVDIEASVSNISDSSSVGAEPSDVLEWLSSVVSHNSSVVPVSPVVTVHLDGHSLSSVALWSDGLSSSVEDKPLLDVSWVVVLDSQSVLVTSDVLSHDKGSSVFH